MPAPVQFILQFYPRIVRYGRDLVSRVVSPYLYDFARPILIEAGAEVLARAHIHTDEWAAR